MIDKTAQNTYHSLEPNLVSKILANFAKDNQRSRFPQSSTGARMPEQTNEPRPKDDKEIIVLLKEAVEMILGLVVTSIEEVRDGKQHYLASFKSNRIIHITVICNCVNLDETSILFKMGEKCYLVIFVNDIIKKTMVIKLRPQKKKNRRHPG